MAEDKVRKLSINQSMTKPLLAFGCDRSLFMLSSLVCAYVGFNLGVARGKVSVALLSVALWVVIHFGLRLMGKADPLMFEVFKRSTQYSDRPFHNQFFLPANSELGAKTPRFTKARWL
jgi:type IV secretory pathway TrbD component